MARALLMIGWLATFGMVATALVGYGVEESSWFEVHALGAIGSALLLLFSHCWIMFYLIGTGKAIRVAVEEHQLDREAVERTREFKNRSYPWLMLAIGLVMTVFIVGGGVATRVIPPWIHQLLFFAALAAQAKALREEHAVLRANEQLMGEVAAQLPGAPADEADAAPGRG